MEILITGGAGFVGSSLAVQLKEGGGRSIICFDNLKRRGSELTLARLKSHGITFIHGDVRLRTDLLELPAADVLIECSAEPSVLAGYGGSPAYLLDTNLSGAVNCFEWARQCRAMVVFLSTSRVYPYDRLGRLPLAAGAERFEWQGEPWEGAGPEGIAESFPLAGIRSLYGATKLAAELVLAEYGAAYHIPYVIDRCGVITGPWQFGKTDQGVFMYWLLSHYFQRPLSYIGYGGQGRQVRDLLHVDDLGELIRGQIENVSQCGGRTYNVGGGAAVSLSLRETTALCRELTGREVPIHGVEQERPADIPWYVTDAGLVRREMQWQPRRTPRQTLSDMLHWIRSHEAQLLQALEQ